jgi:serine/threonine protein kinase
VQQQIGVGATGPVFLAEDPDTHRPVAIKALRTHLPPEVNRQVVDDLAAIIERLPSHPSIVRIHGVGLEDEEPYIVSDWIEGEELATALKQFGPGAIVDLLPRVRALADALDRAAELGIFHGSLHPRDVIVSEDATFLTGIGVAPVLGTRGTGVPIRRPYTAPEVRRGRSPTAASDQFSLAALTFEWLFGRVIAGPAYTPLEVPELPEVSSDQLSDTFTTALAPEPSARFVNCRAFVDGLTAAVPAIVGPPEEDRTVPAIVGPPEEDRAVPAIVGPPEEDRAVPAIVGPPEDDRFTDVPLTSEPEPASPWDDDDQLDTPLDVPLVVEETAEADLKLAPSVPTMIFSAAAAQPDQRRFGLGALAATLFLGMGVGLAGGYLASTSVWRVASPSPSPAQPGENPTVASRADSAGRPVQDSKSGTDVSVAPPALVNPKLTVAPPAPPKKAEPKKEQPAATAVVGRLQIRSTPPGATVQVDGVMRGVTPLALTDVDLGSRTVSLSRTGYVGQERRVTLSKARPSQAIDVRLPPVRTAAATRTAPASPPTRKAPAPPPVAQPAVTGLGGLVIDSRPPGAAVTVNGVPRGTTPISIGRLPVGTYTVTMRLSKYLPVSMVVEVKQGERARAAATLTLMDQQE